MIEVRIFPPFRAGERKIFNRKKYQLPRHGFARDYTFELENHNTDKATFLLCSNAETLKKYPFEFEFRLHYTLDGNQLSLTYDVKNISKGKTIKTLFPSQLTNESEDL